MCQAALAHKGLRNSWKNRELSKNTEEDAVASRRNQISKRKAHDECDPWLLPLRQASRQVASCPVQEGPGRQGAEGGGAADLFPVPWALASRAARVKVLLHLVVEQSPSGGPLSLHLKLCKAWTKQEESGFVIHNYLTSSEGAT